MLRYFFQQSEVSVCQLFIKLYTTNITDPCLPTLSDFTLPERSHLWRISVANHSPEAPPPCLAIGSLDLAPDDINSTDTSVGYASREDTLYVQCNLRPSVFPKQTFTGTTRVDWTTSQRLKATCNIHYLQTVEDLSKHVSRFFHSLCLIPHGMGFPVEVSPSAWKEGEYGLLQNLS